MIHPSLPSSSGQLVLSLRLTQHLNLLPLLPITYMKRMTYLHLGTRLSREVHILILQTIIRGQSCKVIRGQWLNMTVEAINLNHLCNIRVNKENVVHSLLTYFSLPHSSIMDEEDEAAQNPSGEDQACLGTLAPLIFLFFFNKWNNNISSSFFSRCSR